MSATPGSKESRLEAARSRVAFWAIWSEEATTADAKAYFHSRLTHWRHVANSIEMEP